MQCFTRAIRRTCLTITIICLGLLQAIADTVPKDPSKPEKLTSLVVLVTVNQVSKGEYFAYVSDDGIFLFKERDLNQITTNRSWEIIKHENENLVSLKSIPGLKTRFNESNLELHLDFPAEDLGITEINLGKLCTSDRHTA